MLLSLRLKFLLLASVVMLAPTALRAQEVSEYGIRAVLLHRLPQFIYWPNGEKAPTPVVLCVIGKNPFGNTLNQLNQSGSLLDIRYGPNDISICHLLYITRSEAGNVSNWLNRNESLRQITISDINGFARAGGMIELPLEGERVAVVINRKAAQRHGIEFNAQLLRLARVIEP